KLTNLISKSSETLTEEEKKSFSSILITLKKTLDDKFKEMEDPIKNVNTSKNVSEINIYKKEFFASLNKINTTITATLKEIHDNLMNQRMVQIENLLISSKSLFEQTTCALKDDFIII